MTRIEVVTYDVGTGHAQVDRSFDVRHLDKLGLIKMQSWVRKLARRFASEDHSTDHVVYVREV